MNTLTGNRRYRCTHLGFTGYSRSRTTEICVLELEEQDPETGDISWRYATYEDLKDQ